MAYDADTVSYHETVLTNEGRMRVLMCLWYAFGLVEARVEHALTLPEDERRAFLAGKRNYLMESLLIEIVETVRRPECVAIYTYPGRIKRR